MPRLRVIVVRVPDAAGCRACVRASLAGAQGGLAEGAHPRAAVGFPRLFRLTGLFIKSDRRHVDWITSTRELNDNNVQPRLLLRHVHRRPARRPHRDDCECPFEPFRLACPATSPRIGSSRKISADRDLTHGSDATRQPASRSRNVEPRALTLETPSASLPNPQLRADVTPKTAGASRRPDRPTHL